MNSDHMRPSTPQDLISQMKENYNTFLAACRDISPEQAVKPGVCGEWSAKAVLDHLTGWQVESLPILQKLLETDKKDFDLDIDAFNRTSVRDREALTWEESLMAFKLSFKSFEKGLDEITDARYRTNPGLKSWLRAMSQEYQFHIKHIQKASDF